jgi:glycosyltransferase involved in cell wall biosynthesis
MSSQNSSPILGNSSIAVVIPAYKVQDHITRVIAGIPKWVKFIVVVNDASPDETAEILKRVKDRRLHIIHHGINQGVGGAVLSGYTKALSLGANIMVKMDGDGQMDPAYLPTIIDPVLRGKADYAKGNRFLHTTALQRMPFLRRLGNVSLTFFTKIASGYWDIFDPTNGYTAIEKTALSMLSTDQISRDYFFESNMLLALRRINAVIRDVPIPSRYGDEKSSLSISRVLFTFPFRLIKGFFQRISREYFWFDFNAGSLLLLFGLILMVFGFVWGVVKWNQSLVTGIPATTGTVLIAVLPIIVSVQFLTQFLVLDIGRIPKEPLSQIHKTTPD